MKLKIQRTLGPWGVFFDGFLRNPVMVGSIVPSARFTINRMLGPVDWDNCKLFVEYGPGVGTFCRPILNRLPRDGSLIVIDTNPLFIEYLRKRSEEHTSELQSLMRTSYAVFCLTQTNISTLFD